MTGRYNNHAIPYMYYQQIETKQLKSDWLLISSYAKKNEYMQFGSFDLDFHSVEKCHHVTFDQVRCCQFYFVVN